MKNIKFLISVVCFLLIANVSAQSFDLNKYNEEKGKILNVILNTVQFDSIYSSKLVYFASNELLSKATPLIIKRGKCKIKLLERGELKEKKIRYVSLGDFTMPKENPTYVRVQLYSSSTNKTLNLRLEKNKGDWLIINHLIMEN